jgi:hypothetical protein
MDRKLAGPQSRSGRGGEEKISQTLPGLEPPTIQPIAERYTTKISLLLLRRISEPMNKKLKGVWRKLRYEELYNLQFSSGAVTVTKWTMTSGGRVGGMW